MAEEKWKSIKVREWVWRELRVAAAAGDETIIEVVERRLTAGASEVRRPVTKPKAEVPVKIGELPKAPEWMKAEVYTPPVEPRMDEEARCVCGQRLRDHQGGASKRLAVVTNCRNFREA
jgi:hypothetical protein